LYSSFDTGEAPQRASRLTDGTAPVVYVISVTIELLNKVIKRMYSHLVVL
jgi:hypothetical protein